MLQLSFSKRKKKMNIICSSLWTVLYFLMSNFNKNTLGAIFYKYSCMVKIPSLGLDISLDIWLILDRYKRRINTKFGT